MFSLDRGCRAVAGGPVALERGSFAIVRSLPPIGCGILSGERRGDALAGSIGCGIAAFGFAIAPLGFAVTIVG